MVDFENNQIEQKIIAATGGEMVRIILSLVFESSTVVFV